MVEQNTVASINPIGLSVIHRDPIGIELWPPHRGSWDKREWLPFEVFLAPTHKAQRLKLDENGFFSLNPIF
jgi:hypothetical protein